jgi:hypothetical protein
MALKFTVDTLDEVEEPLRQHYVEDNGKFTLATDHPKIAEFRENNIRLTKELAKFEGIDPVAVKADREKITTLEAQIASTPQRVAELESQLATAQQTANRSVLRDQLRDKAVKCGVIPQAIDILLDKAESAFEVKDGAVQAKAFSTTTPGERMTAEEWLLSTTQEFPFLFHPSSGAGAAPSKSNAGGGNGKTVLRDPTPQQLGELASDIKKGLVVVEYTS